MIFNVTIYKRRCFTKLRHEIVVECSFCLRACSRRVMLRSRISWLNPPLPFPVARIYLWAGSGDLDFFGGYQEVFTAEFDFLWECILGYRVCGLVPGRLFGLGVYDG